MIEPDWNPGKALKEESLCWLLYYLNKFNIIDAILEVLDTTEIESTYMDLDQLSQHIGVLLIFHDKYIVGNN